MQHFQFSKELYCVFVSFENKKSIVFLSNVLVLKFSNWFFGKDNLNENIFPTVANTIRFAWNTNSLLHHYRVTNSVNVSNPKTVKNKLQVLFQILISTRFSFQWFIIRQVLWEKQIHPLYYGHMTHSSMLGSHRGGDIHRLGRRNLVASDSTPKVHRQSIPTTHAPSVLNSSSSPKRFY